METEKLLRMCDIYLWKRWDGKRCNNDTGWDLIKQASLKSRCRKKYSILGSWHLSSQNLRRHFVIQCWHKIEDSGFTQAVGHMSFIISWLPRKLSKYEFALPQSKQEFQYPLSQGKR